MFPNCGGKLSADMESQALNGANIALYLIKILGKNL